MVALVAQKLLTGLVVVHVDPKVAAAGDEGLAIGVQRGAIDAVPVRLHDAKIEALQALVRVRVPEGHFGAGGDGERLGVARELDGVHGAAEGELGSLRLRAHVPQPQRLIVAC